MPVLAPRWAVQFGQNLYSREVTLFSFLKAICSPLPSPQNTFLWRYAKELRPLYPREVLFKGGRVEICVPRGAGAVHLGSIVQSRDLIPSLDELESEAWSSSPPAVSENVSLYTSCGQRWAFVRESVTYLRSYAMQCDNGTAMHRGCRL